MNISKHITVLALVFTLTSCGPPAEEQVAILPPQGGTAQTLEQATQEQVAALHNWEFSYDFTPDSIELSSQYAADASSIQSLALNFTPTINNIPVSVVKHEGYYDGVFKQTIGFNMHKHSFITVVNMDALDQKDAFGPRHLDNMSTPQ